MSKYGHRPHDWFEGIVNKLGGESGAEAFLRNEYKLVKNEEVKQIVSGILTLTPARIKFPGTRAPFKASDKFVKTNTEITWYQIGSNFQNWYGAKEEKPLARTTLRAHKLTRNAKDSEIIRELGGEEKAETTLTELYGMLGKQARGGKGALSLEVWKVFYIRDGSGILRAVNVYWLGVGWYVIANSLDDYTWYEGFQVFSRNYKK